MSEATQQLTSELAASANALSVLCLRFRMRTSSTKSLPEYIGSTLHGALGWAAADVNPRWRELLFPMQSELGARDTPNPFVIAVDCYEPWMPVIDWRWTLFGPAAEQVGLILKTVACLAQRGLGADRVPLTVERVEQRLPDGSWQVLAEQGPTMTAPQSMHFGQVLGARREITPHHIQAWAVCLRSPLVLMHQGQMLRQAPRPEVLAGRLLGRFQMMLSEMSSGGTVSRELRDAVIHVLGGRLVEDATEPFQLDRYSHAEGRQRRFMGLSGYAHYADLGLMASTLWTIADWIQVGKKTSYGFGVLEAAPLTSAFN